MIRPDPPCQPEADLRLGIKTRRELDKMRRFCSAFCFECRGSFEQASQREADGTLKPPADWDCMKKPPRALASSRTPLLPLQSTTASPGLSPQKPNPDLILCGVAGASEDPMPPAAQRGAPCRAAETEFYPGCWEATAEPTQVICNLSRGDRQLDLATEKTSGSGRKQFGKRGLFFSPGLI